MANNEEASHTLLAAEGFLASADREHDRLRELKGLQIEYREPWTMYEIMPVLFLYGHAIELLLKAYLLSQGVSIKTLRNDFGHDIQKLYNECSRNHLLLLDRELMPDIMAHHFSDADWHTRFRYIRELQWSFPGCASVQAFAHALLERVRPVCSGADPLDALLNTMPVDDDAGEGLLPDDSE